MRSFCLVSLYSTIMQSNIGNFVNLFESTDMYQAARALANLAAHGDSNSNNAAVGKEVGALEALVQLTQSAHEGVR